jgi:hypothetical protein
VTQTRGRSTAPAADALTIGLEWRKSPLKDARRLREPWTGDCVVVVSVGTGCSLPPFWASDELVRAGRCGIGGDLENPEGGVSVGQ